jgi:hypothetical protein
VVYTGSDGPIEITFISITGIIPFKNKISPLKLCIDDARKVMDIIQNVQWLYNTKCTMTLKYKMYNDFIIQNVQWFYNTKCTIFKVIVHFVL